ncbi:hypothetical protein, partial [Peribacillus frigoritolerans]|uniref:hypothetical protein n=1 Tax=Peribacillus frigoritolerans TaxID=450367 RepID=UPI001E2B8B32
GKPYPGKVYVTLKEIVLQFARSFFNVMVHVWIKFHFNGSFLYTTFNRFIALAIKHKKAKRRFRDFLILFSPEFQKK